MKQFMMCFGIVTMAALALACGRSGEHSLGPTEKPAALGTLMSEQSRLGEIEADAEVHFGSELGSRFSPPEEHDASFHVKDKIFPHVVHIPVGGTIDFEIYPFHQVAIYAPGKTPDDVAANVASGEATLDDLSVGPIFIPDFVINDPEGRVALAPPQALEEHHWLTPPGTFPTAGRYLMICTTVPHFFDAKMYGWVVVR